MVRFFLHIFDFFQHRQKTCIGLWLTIMTLLIVMMASLHYNEDIYEFLPVSGNDKKAISIYQDITGGQQIYAMFKAKNDSDTDTEQLTQAVDSFGQSILDKAGTTGIRELVTQVDIEQLKKLTDFIYQNIPLMLCDSDYLRMEHIISTPSAAEEQLSIDRQMIMMPATSLFAPSIGNDPLGLFHPILERLQARQAAMNLEFEDGYIFTAGKKYAVAMLTSPYGAIESANNSELVEHVKQVALQTMQVLPNVDIAITGAPVISVINASQIKEDSKWAISISVTLILLLLLFSLHKVKNILLIGIAIVFGWLFAMGAISLLRNDVSLIVLGIGSIIIGIAVNYPLHFIAHANGGGSVREDLKEMVAPLLIGNITTVGAFASLMPLNAPALHDLGLFAAFMLVGTILFVLIILPHLVEQKEKTEERLFFEKISNISPEKHRWMLWGIIALTVVFGYFSMKQSFDTQMDRVNYMTETQKNLLSDLHASIAFNDTTNVYVVTEGDTWDQALTERQRIAPLLDSLRQAQMTNSYSDVTKFICSKKEQQHKIDRWNTFWKSHNKETEALLAQTAPKYGFKKDAFSGFERIVANTYTPQPFENFKPICDMLFRSAFSQSTGHCAVVDIIDTKGCDMNKLVTLLNASLGDNGYAFNFIGMNNAIAETLSDNFNYIGIACGCIVFIFLWLSFGRLELSFIAFLPMAMGWLWILGIMNLCGMQFNIVNVILATFIFGQGDDYTIFITDGLINKYAYKKELLPSFKNSIMISALIMFIGIGSLIVARHPALHSLAEVTIVGMTTVVLMAWTVPPLIFNWLIKNGNELRRTPITLDQLFRTAYCSVIRCLLAVYEVWPQRFIHSLLRFFSNHIWGVKLIIQNENGEDFSKNGIVICPYSSALDKAILISLSPRLLPMMAFKDNMTRALKEQALTRADIIPIYIHGSNHIMPTDYNFVTRGQIDVVIGKRLSAKDLSLFGSTTQDIEQALLKKYEYQLLCLKKEIENTHYFHHYVIGKYIYKGFTIEHETRHLLKKYHDYSEWIDNYSTKQASIHSVSILNAGHGQFSLLFALVHPNIEVFSYSYNPEDASLARCCCPLPPNLHIFHCKNQEEAIVQSSKNEIIVNPSRI